MKINLLDKFSHSVHVLSYYDHFVVCDRFMRQIGKSTFKTWINNLNAFQEALKCSVGTLFYLKGFGNKIAKYLLKYDIYRKYNLDIILNSNKAYESFGEFLNMLPEDKPALIKRISVAIIYECIDAYFNFYKLLMTKKYSPDIIHLDDFRVMSYKKYKIPYIPKLQYHNSNGLIERTGTLTLGYENWYYIKKNMKYFKCVDNLIVGYFYRQKFIDEY